MQPPPCNADIFKDGHAICVLDACQHRAEDWVQSVARASGQAVDWHYSGGIANVLYIGDHAKVAAAVADLTPTLSLLMVRKAGECGSCSDPSQHRPGRVLRTYEPAEHGLYRAGDAVPRGTCAGYMGLDGEPAFISHADERALFPVARCLHCNDVGVPYGCPLCSRFAGTGRRA